MVEETPYRAAAAAAVDKLTSTWFTPATPALWVPNDFWKTPTLIEELIDYAALAGGPPSGYPGTLETLASASAKAKGWIGSCGYYDDETCWGRMWIAAREWLAADDATLAARYEKLAVAVHDDLQEAWTTSESVCGGGVWWQRGGAGAQGNFKATNATLGLMEIALGLYAATRTATYLQTAQDAWGWIADHELVDAHGMVWGGLTDGCAVAADNVPVVALQGNPLGPLWRLYAATQDTAALDAAEAIADGTLASAMVWPGTQILTTPIDAQWSDADETFHLDNGGVVPFKGIFASFLGDFAAKLATVDDPARQAAARRYGAALRANADSLLAQYPQGIYDMDWSHGNPAYAGDDDDQTAACLQYSGICALVAAAKAP